MTKLLFNQLSNNTFWTALLKITNTLRILKAESWQTYWGKIIQQQASSLK